MELDLYRFSGNGKATMGALVCPFQNNFTTFAIEDQRQIVKVMNETRIPAGKYEIKLRKAGGYNKKFIKRFGDRHHGMLWLQDVPGFEWIYIHPGNDDGDTSGCILPAMVADLKTYTTMESTDAYLIIYDEVAAAILAGERVFITIHDPRYNI